MKIWRRYAKVRKKKENYMKFVLTTTVRGLVKIETDSSGGYQNLDEILEYIRIVSGVHQNKCP